MVYNTACKEKHFTGLRAFKNRFVEVVSVNGERAYICRLIDIYGNALSARQRDVVDLYYNEDLSLAEISENCGITRQGVRDAIRHGVETLRNLESALGFDEKLNRIADLAREIKQNGGSDEIKRLAESIIGEL
jgi:predicted DNA-binding protein YlxM (UPF0122 family)